MTRRLLLAARGAAVGFAPPPPPPPPDWSIAGGAALDASLAATLAGNAISVVTGGVTREQGYRPAAIYNALWTRDHAYVIWHKPDLLTATQRRQFVTYTLGRRTTGVEADPDGGTLPADFIADRISAGGTATYKNAGASKLPFLDGIAFVVLALWTDWSETGDLATFTASRSAIDACLAAIPRSGSGCVYSDPAHPSVDYGFTDGVLKTGDVAYGTALQAWAYKMLAEMNGEAGSGTYTTLRTAAEAGLATLRQSSGWYRGSSGNNATRDDVWATALAVAEELVSGSDRTDSAQTIADAHAGGSTGVGGYSSSVSQFGLVRHLPVGQSWAGTSETAGTYQNGGYWLTPLWDVVRAVDLVDSTLARSWAAEAIAHVQDEATNEGGDYAKVPWEWHDYPGRLGALGYSASAALMHRFV